MHIKNYKKDYKKKLTNEVKVILVFNRRQFTGFYLMNKYKNLMPITMEEGTA